MVMRRRRPAYGAAVARARREASSRWATGKNARTCREYIRDCATRSCIRRRDAAHSRSATCRARTWNAPEPDTVNHDTPQASIPLEGILVSADIGIWQYDHAADSLTHNLALVAAAGLEHGMDRCPLGASACAASPDCA